MRNLLSNHELKLLTLLEELNKTRENTSLRELSKTLNIPIRTISTYIQEFNAYKIPIQITSDNRGVRLIIPKEHSFRYVYSLFYRQNLELSILQQIFLNEQLTLDELAEKNFVSVSTIKRAIWRIKPILKKEGMILSLSDLSIDGEEEKIRQFFNYYYDEKYIDLEFLMDDQEQILHKLVTHLFNERGIKIYRNQVTKYIRWMYLNSIRIKNNHQVQLKKHTFTSSELLFDATVIDEFELLFEIPLNLETINDMLYHLNNNYYFYSYSQIQKIADKSTELKKVISNIQKNLREISVDLGIDLPSSTENMLVLDLVNLLQFRDSRTFILYNRRAVFLKHLGMKYPGVINYLSSYILNLSSVKLSNSGISELLYILLTHWYELYDYLHKIGKSTDVYILVDTDLEHALFIKKELEKYCRYNIRCKLWVDDETIEIDNQSVLVTSIASTPETVKNVICFSDYFSDRNWNDFNSMINKLINGN